MCMESKCVRVKSVTACSQWLWAYNQIAKEEKLCLSVDLLNDYMHFFTGLYCESLICLLPKSTGNTQEWVAPSQHD